MRTALAFLAVVVSPLLLECSPTCQVGNQNDYVEGLCPIKLSSNISQVSGQVYAECVTVCVWMKAHDVRKCPKIEIVSPIPEVFRPTLKKTRKNCSVRSSRERVRCSKHNNTIVTLWELVYDCISATALQVVSVSYSTASASCNVSYTVPDPVPDFNVSVNQSSKSIALTVKSGEKVHARLCYQASAFLCSDVPGPFFVTIDPYESPTVRFSITHLLPCLCVEVYYTHKDARRTRTCLFQKERLADIRDVWLSSGVELYESRLLWVSRCSPSDLPGKISASLCWMQRLHVCTPVLNSSLQVNDDDDGGNTSYNTSAVDRHPRMCVLFSLQGSQNIFCPFQADMSTWDVHIGPGRQSVVLYVTSLVPAMFSAQFCVLNKMGCTPIGPAHAVGTGGTQIHMPPHFISEKPCVQVWQTDPALRGKRILCPEYTRNRCGMYAVAALMFVIAVVLLGLFIHRFTRSGAAGWLYIQKPVLLVCSSEHSAHVSAACALGSILQGELSAKVHTALWAQSSQQETRPGTGVSDLGPIPWLYGQWAAVRKAEGKVLIIWSPEARKVYETCSEERTVVDQSERKKEDNSGAELRHERIKGDADADYKLNERLGKCKRQKTTGKKDCVQLCDEKNWYPQKVPSTVTGPVFAAALACLEGALQQYKGLGVAIVYFEGLGHIRDIPKALRGVPRYCLPQDFRGLIQELGCMRRPSKTGKFAWHCWPRLLSKVLSIWLARKLANRLQTLLPRSQGKKMQGPSATASQKRETRNRIKLPLEANMARTAPTQEQGPLHEPPQRAEKL